MLNQFEDIIIGKLVEQLNNHGINVNAETLKNAMANSPQIVAQIETILATSDTKEKIAKITALLQSAGGGTATPTYQNKE